MSATAQSPLASVRAAGEVRLEVKAGPGGRTMPARVGERGGLRVRLPRVDGMAEAVLINTGGGMAGGDTARLRIAVGPGAALTVATQSAEKVYRSDGATTGVHVDLTLGGGSTLHWLPQETILFQGARLSRTLTADMPAGASLLIAEALVLGRLAMGETMTEGRLRDRWRIRRAGRLAFAEDLALDGPISERLARPALGGGARAAATLLLVSADAEASLDDVRAAIGDGVEAGASAWNGLLVARYLSRDPALLRGALVRSLQVLRGTPMPRVWQC